jgi:hypothetical protein
MCYGAQNLFQDLSSLVSVLRFRFRVAVEYSQPITYMGVTALHF